MKKSILVTVIMSTYNEEEQWLTTAIDSILQQNHKELQFIIVNDNPRNENNGKLLDDYKALDSRIQLIINGENKGLTKSLNSALDLAVGEYIARMDADDYSYPTRLTNQLDFMRKNLHIVACGSQIRTFGKFRRTDKSLPTDSKKFRNMLLLKNPLAHPSAMIRTSTLEAHSIRYNELLPYAQDYDLWCKLSKFGGLVNLPEILVEIRVRDGQISVDKRVEQFEVAKKIRKSEMHEYLLECGIENNSWDVRALYGSIKEAVSKGDRRSFALLALFLSMKEYCRQDIVNLVKHVDRNLVFVNYPTILKRLALPERYRELL